MCVQTFVKQANFLPHHLGGMTLNQALFHVFWSFFNFLELKFHATPCMCAHALRPVCLKIRSDLLHMELTRTQVHKNMIFQKVIVRRCM